MHRQNRPVKKNSKPTLKQPPPSSTSKARHTKNQPLTDTPPPTKSPYPAVSTPPSKIAEKVTDTHLTSTPPIFVDLETTTQPTPTANTPDTTTTYQPMRGQDDTVVPLTSTYLVTTRTTAHHSPLPSSTLPRAKAGSNSGRRASVVFSRLCIIYRHLHRGNV